MAGELQLRGVLSRWVQARKQTLPGAVQGGNRTISRIQIDDCSGLNASVGNVHSRAVSLVTAGERCALGGGPAVVKVDAGLAAGPTIHSLD